MLLLNFISILFIFISIMLINGIIPISFLFLLIYSSLLCILFLFSLFIICSWLLSCNFITLLYNNCLNSNEMVVTKLKLEQELLFNKKSYRILEPFSSTSWNDSQAIVDRKIAKTGNKMKCFIAISSISKFYGLNHREFRFLHG